MTTEQACAEPRVRLWSTKAEIDDTRVMLAKAKAGLS